MKKFVISLICIMFILISLFIYSKYRINSYNNLLTATNSYNYNFEIPKNVFGNPDNLELLKKSAKENNINLVRTIAYYNENDKKSYVDNFVYLSNDTCLFEKIPLSEKSNITDINLTKNAFLSTQKTNNENQIGYIKDFGGGHNYFIYNIDKLLEQYSFYGIYKAECENKEQFNEFLNDYTKYIYEKYKDIIVDLNQEEIIKISENTTNIKNINNNNYIYISIFIFILLILTFIFYLVLETKTISIMKLNGYNINKIKHKIFSFLYLKSAIYINIIIFIFSIISIQDIKLDFIITLLLYNMFIFIFSYLIIDIISSFYIKYVEITYCIKGKKPLKLLITLNIIFKLIISTIIIIIACNLTTNLKDVYLKQKSLKYWEIASNYGVFYPVKTGEDAEQIQNGENVLDIPAYDIYLKYYQPIMNAIYINSTEYIPKDIKEISTDPNFIRKMFINNNYLKVFNIYDENNKIIEISNDIEETILLVPEKYKNNEKYILDYFIELRKSFHEVHKQFYGLKEKPKVEDIKIIYTKNNQDIFSFNINVFPEKNNMITDPIIMVMTPNNTLATDISYISLDNMKLFIPLKDMDAKLTYDFYLKEELQKYSLDDNFKYFIKIDDFILQNINNVKKEINTLIIIISFISILLIIILIQFIYLIFEKNKFEIFLKKTFGYNYFEKYSNIYGIIMITNSLEFSFCLYLSNILSFDLFITIFLFKILIEFIIINILIKYLEKRNVINILKEGI